MSKKKIEVKPDTEHWPNTPKGTVPLPERSPCHGTRTSIFAG